MARFTRYQRGFALAEAVGLVVIGAILLSILVIAGVGQRREARLASDFAKLRRIAGYTESYAADFQGHIWGFSWTKEMVPLPTQYPDLKSAATDLQACANQAVDILRRVGDREDIPVITGWIPHISYSHLPLVDWVGLELPTLDFVSESDRYRWLWANDPAGFDAGKYLPYQPTPSPVNKRWPYSGSFEIGPATWDRSIVGNRVNQHGFAFDVFAVPSGGIYGPARVTDVTYPFAKTHVYARSEWVRTGEIPALAECARVPMLFFDGAASRLLAAECNPGWNPNGPVSSVPTTIYTEDPCAPGSFLIGRFRWTRGGLAGRDFGGPEVDTGQ